MRIYFKKERTLREVRDYLDSIGIKEITRILLGSNYNIVEVKR